MVGSSVLVVPLMFVKTGVILSTLICLLVGLLSQKTASLVLKHFKADEMDLSDAVLRVLGRPYHLSFVISSILLLYLAALVYFLLTANLCYDLISLFLFKAFDHTLPPKNNIVYSTFSFQYTGMILTVVFSLIFMLKDLKVFIKAGSVGIGAIFIYILYMVVLGI